MKKIFLTLCLFILFSSLNAQWVSLPSPINVDFHCVRFISPEVGWVCGDNGIILKTTNGGSDWEIQNFDSTYVLNSIFFIDSLRGWAVGGSTTNHISLEKSILLSTKDGGSNWRRDSCKFDQFLCSVFFSEKNKGWITGSDGILFTSDEGNSWEKAFIGYDFETRDPFYSIDSCIWTARYFSYYPIVFKSDDMGITWASLYFNHLLPNVLLIKIYSINFINKDEGWLVFISYDNMMEIPSYGGIIHTLDGGYTWNKQLITPHSGIFCVGFTDSLNGWAVGGEFRESRGGNKTESQIFNTNNGGINWIKQNAPDSVKYKAVCSIYPISNNICYAVGDSGLILKTINGGTPVEEENIFNPKKFYLSQNFPNPFNPSTTIRYQIPSSGFISLKVYDVLGKEVATLVNEYKPAGNYEIEFNTSRGEVTLPLPSGIYFYQLKAGNYIETKKLVLMK